MSQIQIILLFSLFAYTQKFISHKANYQYTRFTRPNIDIRQFKLLGESEKYWCVGQIVG